MGHPLNYTAELDAINPPGSMGVRGWSSPAERTNPSGGTMQATRALSAAAKARIAAERQPVSAGAFRPSRISGVKSDQVGVGIIAYYGLDDVKRALASIMAHGGEKYHVAVFDNSENFEVGQLVTDSFPSVHYERSPYNVGCSNARNRLAETFAALGIQHFIIQDQDVEWVADPVPQMLKVFADCPDTGIVGWKLATEQMGPRYKIDGTGTIPELPGMCNMYSLDAVASIPGWNPAMFMYRFDSLFCIQARARGFKTRVVMSGRCAVEHNHPHRGIMRYPHWRREQMRSVAIFRQVLTAEGLTSAL